MELVNDVLKVLDPVAEEFFRVYYKLVNERHYDDVLDQTDPQTVVRSLERRERLHTLFCENNKEYLDEELRELYPKSSPQNNLVKFK